MDQIVGKFDQIGRIVKEVQDKIRIRFKVIWFSIRIRQVVFYPFSIIMKLFNHKNEVNSEIKVAFGWNFHVLVCHSDLNSPKTTGFKLQKLITFVTMEPIKRIKLDTYNTNEPDEPSLNQRSLIGLQKSNTFCDALILLEDGGCIPVHRVILCSASDYF